jgi:hypothetical protein
VKKNTPEPSRNDNGRYAGREHSAPDPAVALTPRNQEARDIAQRLNRLASGLEPGTVNVAFTYPVAHMPELAYLIRHDGLITDVHNTDGPVISSTAGTKTQTSPRTLFNQLLSAFPDPDEAIACGFATTDDGVVYLVAARYQSDIS